jgi:hypothetical protein
LTKYICDRCGQEKKFVQKLLMGTVNTIPLYDRHNKNLEPIDLCFDCIDDLKVWLQPKEQPHA